MSLIRRILKWTTSLIYALLAVVVLYFPAVALLSYFARETHLVRFRSNLAVDDSLLPCLVLAIIFAVVPAIRTRIERADVPEENGPDPIDG